MSGRLVAILLLGCATLGGCANERPGAAWQQQAHARATVLAESLVARAPRIVWLGDSIARAWERDGATSWRLLFEPRGAMNLGIGGERTFTLVDRIASWPRPIPPPELVILHIGTNDTNDGPVPAAELAERILSAAATVEARWQPGRILVSAVLPRDRRPTDRRRSIAAANQLVRAECAVRGYLYLDAGPLFLSPDGTIPESLMPDALHLSAEAYRLWAAELAPIVDAVFAPAPSTPPDTPR